jgi:hypothetical protein
MRAVDDFFNEQQEPVKSCLLALRELVIQFNGHMSEHWKYRMPCYCYKKNIFCYLWIDKKVNWPYILMVEGRNIKHPSLVIGNRSRMKILMIDPAKDIPVRTIKSIFNMAVKLYQ